MTINNSINIIADDREQKSGVLQALSEIDQVNLSIQRLSIGDYRIDNRVTVERKALSDFAISIIDGRLFKQTVRLADSHLKGVLILEGSSKDTIDLGIAREAMQGALISVSLILGIPVLRAIDSTETAKLMVYIARQINAIAHGGIQRQGHRPKGKRKRQLYILQGLPGIGHERAARLLDTFGSVEGVVSAGSEELKMIEGIGEKIADRIKWAVSEEIKSYGKNISDEEALL